MPDFAISRLAVQNPLGTFHPLCRATVRRRTACDSPPHRVSRALCRSDWNVANSVTSIGRAAADRSEIAAAVIACFDCRYFRVFLANSAMIHPEFDTSAIIAR